MRKSRKKTTTTERIDTPTKRQLESLCYQIASNGTYNRRLTLPEIWLAQGDIERWQYDACERYETLRESVVKRASLKSCLNFSEIASTADGDTESERQLQFVMVYRNFRRVIGPLENLLEKYAIFNGQDYQARVWQSVEKIKKPRDAYVPIPLHDKAKLFEAIEIAAEFFKIPKNGGS
jgi:hypothetical protein